MKKSIFASLTILAVLTGSASASLIVGDIGFTGTLDVSPNSGHLGSATGIDFVSAQVAVTAGDFVAAGPMGTPVAFTDFTFAPALPAAVVPLWSVGGFTFDLESISVIFQNATNLILSGGGTLKHASFDDTLGKFQLSTQGGKANFTFSANSSSTPEPTSILVWGGLAVASVVARRRRRS